MPDHFASLKDAIIQMEEMFTGDVLLGIARSGYLRKLLDWNELFIELAYICFDRRIVIIEDLSIDVSGTSIKSSKVVEHINLILPNGVAANGQYILLLRRKKKSKSLFSSNYIYYPIFTIMPQSFFKDMAIEKKVYSWDEEIIKLLRRMNIGVSEEAITAPPVRKFLAQNGIEPSDLVNERGLCYALTFSTKSVTKCMNWFVWPIPLERTDSIMNICPKIVAKYPPTFAQWKPLLMNYNKYIIQEAEEQGRYQITAEVQSHSWVQRRSTGTIDTSSRKNIQISSVGFW